MAQQRQIPELEFRQLQRNMKRNLDVFRSG